MPNNTTSSLQNRDPLERLSGSIERVAFKHNEDNPLSLDVLVIDEPRRVRTAYLFKVFR
jgi:hypothetical protein